MLKDILIKVKMRVQSTDHKYGPSLCVWLQLFYLPTIQISAVTKLNISIFSYMSLYSFEIWDIWVCRPFSVDVCLLYNEYFYTLLLPAVLEHGCFAVASWNSQERKWLLAIKTIWFASDWKLWTSVWILPTSYIYIYSVLAEVLYRKSLLT